MATGSVCASALTHAVTVQSKSKKKDKLIKSLRAEIIKLQQQLGIAPESYPGDGDVSSRYTTLSEVCRHHLMLRDSGSLASF